MLETKSENFLEKLATNMYPLLFILIGITISYLFNINAIENSKYITYISDVALAIGLYGSVYAIDIESLKKNLNVVLSAISIGVILKISIIGGILWLYMQTPIAFLLAAIIAQIDPLSISALEKNKNLSKDGETILRAWSSFDDPITIIVSLWLASFIYINTSVSFNEIISNAAITFYYNIIMAVVVYFLWRYLRPHNKVITCFSLLFLSFILTIYFELYLGFAIIALFVRPPLFNYEGKITFVTLLIVSIVLGMLLTNGVNIITGVIMGVSTIFSQLIVSYYLTEKMTFQDKIKLSFAHQSGITAIALSLYFIQYDSSLIKSIAVAIVTINIGYFFANQIIDKFIIPSYEKKP